jgi:hypothetical protein
MVLAAHPTPTAPVMSHFSLEGKTTFITGGTRGIGLEGAYNSFTESTFLVPRPQAQ